MRLSSENSYEGALFLILFTMNNAKNNRKIWKEIIAHRELI